MTIDNALADQIADAARAVYADVRERVPDECLYYFGLVSHPAAFQVAAAANTDESLARVLDRYRTQSDSRSESGHDQTLLASLRWHGGDLAYLHLGVSDEFAAVNAELARREDKLPRNDDDGVAWDALRATLVASSIEALRRLDREGLFGEGETRNRLVLNFLELDQSNESIIANARALNPPAALNQLIADLPVTTPTGEFVTLGERAYQVAALSTTNDGRRVMAGLGDGGLQVWEWPSRREVMRVGSRRGGHWCGAIAGDGSVAYLGSENCVLRWSVPGRRARKPIGTAVGTLASIALLQRPDRLVVSGWDDETVCVDPKGRELWRVVFAARGLASSNTGSELALAGTTVLIVDAASGTRLRGIAIPDLTPPISGLLAAVTWLPGGRIATAGLCDDEERVLVAGPGDGVLSVATRDEPRRIGGVTALAVSPSGGLLASTHTHGELRIRRTDTFELLATYRGAQESLSAVTFLDDTHVAAAGRDVNCGPPVYVWRIR